MEQSSILNDPSFTGFVYAEHWNATSSSSIKILNQDGLQWALRHQSPYSVIFMFKGRSWASIEITAIGCDVRFLNEILEPCVIYSFVNSKKKKGEVSWEKLKVGDSMLLVSAILINQKDSFHPISRTYFGFNLAGEYSYEKKWYGNEREQKGSGVDNPCFYVENYPSCGDYRSIMRLDRGQKWGRSIIQGKGHENEIPWIVKHEIEWGQLICS